MKCATVYTLHCIFATIYQYKKLKTMFKMTVFLVKK